MRKNIIIMNLLVAFFWMTQYSYMPNLPVYSQSLGADAVTLGVIGGVYGIAQIILRIPIGVTSDRTGKNKLMLIIGCSVLALSCAILIAARDTNTIILGRLVAGAAAAWWVVLSATYADYHSDDKQVRAQGVLSASSSAGKVVSAIVGGVIALYFGIHSIFIFAFIMAIVCLILSFRLTDLPKKPQAKSFRDIFPLFKNKDLIVLSVIGILLQLICFAAPGYFTAIAADNLKASSFDIGMLNLVFFLSTGITSLFVGSRIYRKVGGIKVLIIAFLISAFTCIPLFYHINIGVIYIMQMVAGLSYGITNSAVAGLVIRCVTPDQRGAATGIYQSIYGIGIVLGPVLVGSITKAVAGGTANWSDVSYWVLVAISVVTAIGCWLLIPKKY
ncbi:MAG: MFS transporter, partial [Eubacteriales bacterium]